MAKLNIDPITKNDISEYLEKYSDFYFEIKVLEKLTSLGFSCEHAGTYEDPITKKTREFDIRARKRLINESDFKFNISLSVECKNLKDNFPLVVHCMPREESECYLDLIWSSKPTSYTSPYLEYAMRVPLNNTDSPYAKLDPVGKSSDQVGRAAHNSNLISNGGDVFDKISQAINASYDLIREAHYSAKEKIDVVTLIIPVLVTPNDRLWTVWYKLNGGIEREPTLEGNIQYYIDKSWLTEQSSNEYQQRYYLSHLEIVQIDSIHEMIEKYAKTPSTSSSHELRLKKLQALDSRT